MYFFSNIFSKGPQSNMKLQRLSLENIARNILNQSKFSSEHIPLDISQQIFEFCIEAAGGEEVDVVLKWFLEKPSHTPLRQICLRNARQVDVGLVHCLVKENLETLIVLDIRGCRSQSKKFWSLLNKAPKLTALKTTNLLIPLRCPKLQVLVVDWKPKKMLQRLQCHFQSTYYDKLFKHVLVNLTHLDLSWCHWVKHLRKLGNARALEVLILRNCNISGIVDVICQLTELRILDISIGVEHEFNQDFNGTYSDPDCMLRRMVTSLTKLDYLDISGTNLASTEEKRQISLLNTTQKNTLQKFLEIYSAECNESAQVEHISASANSKVILQEIQTNLDRPKTLQDHISNFKSMERSSLDVDMLLQMQIQMLRNLRTDEHFRFWALKCLCNFLDQLGVSIVKIKNETRKELFLVLNRLNYSHAKCAELPEMSLRFSFQIFIQLLSVEEINDDVIISDLFRLGKFLVSLNRANFIYFKTEAILFRLLYRLSLRPKVCTYLSKNSVLPICFDFFKTIQVYLGFSLTMPQTSEVVTITWKCVLNLMQSSQYATEEFIKFKGLSWMYAHISWFSYDNGTQRELRAIFMTILQFLTKYLEERGDRENKHNHTQMIPRLSQELMRKVSKLIYNPSTN